MEEAETKKVKPERLKRFPGHSICFLMALLVLIGIYCHHAKNAIKDLRDAHEKIILTQREHNSKLDSTFCRFDQRCFAQIESNVNTLLPDLTGKDSLFLVSTLIERDSITKSLLIGLLQKNDYNEFLTNTSLFHNELEGGIDNIERVLELHLNKVEHEYANITIWAAVLTILFLVFSFYSLFRLEDLKKEAEGTVDLLKNKTNELGSFSEIINNKIQGIKVEVDAQISPIKEKAESDLQNKTNEYQLKFDQLLEEYTNLLDQIKKERVQTNENNKEEGVS